MFCQSPRFLHAAALRDTLYGMNCRLGYVQQVKKAGHLGMAWHQGTCNGALRQCPHHHSRPSRASSTSNNHAGHSGQTISPREYGAGNERPEGQLKGHIDIIMGPMFAGKTSELLRKVEDHEAAGQKVALVKSSVDTRYHSARIVTHDGHSKACYAAASLAELRDCLGDEYSSFSVIAIDEAQFLPDLLPFCMHAADVEHKHVLVAGLDGDFKRQRFGQVLDLVPMADKVTKLGGRCAYCSSRALFSLRIAADERQALVGGADKYAPVCRRHYTELSELRPSEA